MGLTEFVRTLSWPDEKNPEKDVGVVEVDLLVPSIVDHISPALTSVLYQYQKIIPIGIITQTDRLSVKSEFKPLKNNKLYYRRRSQLQLTRYEIRATNDAQTDHRSV